MALILVFGILVMLGQMQHQVPKPYSWLPISVSQGNQSIVIHHL